jgi:hypothetical protein
MAGALRFGILFHEPGPRAWEARAIGMLRSSPAVHLCLAASAPASRPREAFLPGPANPALRAVWKALEAKFPCRHDAGADAPDPLVGVPRPSARPGTPEWTASIRQAGLDVLLCFGGDPGPGAAGLARLGAWRIFHGDPEVPGMSPPGFREITERDPVTGACLLARLDEGPDRILFRSAGATMDISLRLNHERNCWKSAAFPARAAERLRAAGIRDAEGLRKAFPARANAGAAPAGTGAWMRFLAGNVKRRLENQRYRKRYREEWTLFASRSADWRTLPAGLTPLPSPPDRFWADPCIARDGDRTWLFFEELIYSAQRGHLSVMELLPDGSHGEPARILEKEYHLSYPFVFREGGVWYMVPESSGNRTIQLYRATRFPFAWEHARDLMRDVHAVDTTLIRRDGRWWMFTNLAHTPGVSSYDELYLFHSERLDAEWSPHPMNPIVSDVRRARSAGPLFEDGGMLIRPAQDCSRSYGNGIVWNRVETLTTSAYAETPMGRLAPGWEPPIVGTHTYTAADGLTVIDALVRRPRS